MAARYATRQVGMSNDPILGLAEMDSLWSVSQLMGAVALSGGSKRMLGKGWTNGSGENGRGEVPAEPSPSIAAAPSSRQPSRSQQHEGLSNESEDSTKDGEHAETDKPEFLVRRLPDGRDVRNHEDATADKASNNPDADDASSPFHAGMLARPCVMYTTLSAYWQEL